MKIEIRQKPFIPWKELENYQRQIEKDGQFGAMAAFVGSMRDFNEGESVNGMLLEYYPGMTDKHLEEICNAAREKWELVDILVLHRVGKIDIADPIVLVSVWSAHRAEAFEACRFIMEDLKARAPFWKQESLQEGKRWVEKNTPG